MKRCPFCGTKVQDATCCRRCARERRSHPARTLTEPKGRKGKSARAADYATSLRDPKDHTLSLIGLLLVATGFAATFVAAWWGYGFLAIWTGCGVGLQGSRQVRWGGGLAVGLTLVLFSAVIASTANASASPEEDQGPPAFLVVTVQSITYGQEELRVRGIVENTGVGIASRPAIELSVYSESGKTLLAAATAYPGGTNPGDLEPGREAPFEHLALVAGEPERIRWTITVEDYAGEVLHHSLKLGYPAPTRAQLLE